VPRVLGVVKGFAEKLPSGIGVWLSRLPFSMRLGLGYRASASEIVEYITLYDQEIERRNFYKLKSIVDFAYDNIPFYRELYGDNGFNPRTLYSWSDWFRVPVITKSDLKGWSLEDRMGPSQRKMLVNTGGTSGQPLEFYLDARAFAREWAHMHYVWKARGYRQTDIKLTFRGKHFDRAVPVRYNAVHNEYVVNASTPIEEVVDAVLDLSGTECIRWIHGYPSLVSEFANEVARRDSVKVSILRSKLFGVLLGSEYPAPIYRSVIAENLSVNIVCWYGHSEMSVLARETSIGLYESLPTYGYAEAVGNEESEDHRLICTSFHNRAHPFIRYDTGDTIEPVSQRAGSLAFRIREGRVGDFVVDKRGNRHSLTAIIFGRHHAAFELIEHLQVRDEGDGRLVLVVTSRSPSVSRESLMGKFDLTDLDFDFSIELVSDPVRTKAGKIRLKI